jgi:hypothetical protein
MLAIRSRSRTIFLVLALSWIRSTPSYSQSANPFAVNRSSNRTSSGAWLAKCEPASRNDSAAWRLDHEMGSSALPDGLAGDSSELAAPDAACMGSALFRGALTPADNSCRLGSTGVSVQADTFRCHGSGETVLAELSTLGKAGQKIARARDEVLDILHSENACTQWFETKDGTPAETFESLRFSVDQYGQRNVFESLREQSGFVMRQPYVARAVQNAGAHTMITINAYGAFYRTEGLLQKDFKDGGPLHIEGARVLTVGAYGGNTLRAQMITLLHEFGHIINLLPEDADNLDGESVRNTDEVMKHCRAEVEAHSKQTAKR